MSKGRAVQREKPEYNVRTVSRVYKDINREKGADWFNVDDFAFPVSSPDPYRVIDWVGSGKYSDVFTAYNIANEKTIFALKVLKPVRPQKYARETKILLNLRGGPNIIQLLDITQNPISKQYSLVFEYVNETDEESLFGNISDIECRTYFYKLMCALQFSHSQGIMHRDVKPLNILYDISTKKLRLIDWGLADFYHPGQNYNIHVASRHYKPPELLLDYQLYDYSIDIWSFGATMASILFKKFPFFSGKDDLDMIVAITNVLGYQELRKYTSKYGLVIPSTVAKKVINLPGQDWSAFLPDTKTQIANSSALDLLSKCLKFDHMERITAEEAIKHHYFDPVRNVEHN